jgi:hypothetical protein
MIVAFIALTTLPIYSHFLIGKKKRIRKKGVAIKLVKWSTREGNCRNGRVWLEGQNNQIRTKMVRCCKNLVGRKRFFRSRRQSESGKGVRIQNDRKHALDGPFAKFMTALWRPKRRLQTSGDPAYLGTVGEGGEFLKDAMKTVSKTKLTADLVKTTHADQIAIRLIIHDSETEGLSVGVLDSGRSCVAFLGMGKEADPQQQQDIDNGLNVSAAEEGNKVHRSKASMRQVSTILGVNRLLINNWSKLTLPVNPC